MIREFQMDAIQDFLVNLLASVSASVGLSVEVFLLLCLILSSVFFGIGRYYRKKMIKGMIFYFFQGVAISFFVPIFTWIVVLLMTISNQVL